MLVVDASVLAPAVADGGADGFRFRRRLRSERLAGPDLLRVEVVSVVRRQARTRALPATRAEAAIADLLALPITVYPTAPLLRRAWWLRANLTAYDACYVALAEVLGCALLTADTRLARAPGGVVSRGAGLSDARHGAALASLAAGVVTFGSGPATPGGGN